MVTLKKSILENQFFESRDTLVSNKNSLIKIYYIDNFFENNVNMNHSVFLKFGIFMMFISSTSLIELVTLYEDTYSITLTISQVFLKK